MVAGRWRGASNAWDGTPEASASLIAAAEQLFADRGIDGVSLREINREAQQRNTTSLQYHFGDREGLLRAILAKHGREVDARRNALLDQYEANGVDDIRALASAFVLPLVAKLHDPDGGRCYLRIAAELVNRSKPARSSPSELSILSDPLGHDPRDSITRWSQLVGPLLPPSVVGPPLHRRYAAMRFAHIELGRRAMRAARTRATAVHQPPRRPGRVARWSPPVSEETGALLERSASSSGRPLAPAHRAAASRPHALQSRRRRSGGRGRRCRRR